MNGRQWVSINLKRPSWKSPSSVLTAKIFPPLSMVGKLKIMVHCLLSTFPELQASSLIVYYIFTFDIHPGSEKDCNLNYPCCFRRHHHSYLFYQYYHHHHRRYYHCHYHQRNISQCFHCDAVFIWLTFVFQSYNLQVFTTIYLGIIFHFFLFFFPIFHTLIKKKNRWYCWREQLLSLKANC